MSKHIDRRKFLKSSLVKTGTGVIVLNEILGPGMIGKRVRLLTAAERGDPRGVSSCHIQPAVIEYRESESWTLTYTPGAGGLPQHWALVVRCLSAVGPDNNLLVQSSWPNYTPIVTIKENVGISRVIWIEGSGDPLPEGATLTITLENYQVPITTASCAFSVLEVDPDGSEPELGSGLTFLEVPVSGGQILPETTKRFNVVIPSRAQVNEPMRIRIAALDLEGLGTPEFEGTLQLSASLPFQDLPPSVTFTKGDKGSLILEAIPLAAGTCRIQAQLATYMAESNPCVCGDAPVEEGIFWGDYHKHSFHCDGHLFPEEIYDFAKRYAFLDFGMLSSHDMWAFPHRGARNWIAIHGATEAAHEPGVFVTFQGYEWTHGNPFSPDDARGHKVVIFLNPDHLLPLIPFSYDEDPLTVMPPTTLFKELKDRAGKDVIVIPHHLPLYKWWRFPAVPTGEMGGPLPALRRAEIDAIQPVAEVFSKEHGNNESYGLKDWIKHPTLWGHAINHTFWLDALKRGVRAGAVCAGDNHYKPLGHPDDTALTAVLAPALDRESIFRAIQKRRTYGTSGPRVVVDFSIGEAKMGDRVPCKPGGSDPPCIKVSVASSLSIDYIEVVRVRQGHAEVPHIESGGSALEVDFTWEDTDYKYCYWVCYYLRIHLDNDAHGAWTSPIWFEPFDTPQGGSAS